MQFLSYLTVEEIDDSLVYWIGQVQLEHEMTGVIVRDIHHQKDHVGTEQVLSSLREFWIPKAKSFIRQILCNCFTCRKKSAVVTKLL